TFSPVFLFAPGTWAVGPGWYGARRWRCFAGHRRAANAPPLFRRPSEGCERAAPLALLRPLSDGTGIEGLRTRRAVGVVYQCIARCGPIVRAFSPVFLFAPGSWAVGPGWYGARRWR